MSNFISWILTNQEGDSHLASWGTSSDELGLPAKEPWSVRKRTLRGGLADGVDTVELDNGAFQVTLLPTRGMSLWRGYYNNLPLGWRSPVRGPVHPAHVNEEANGGLGWLKGFDEWIVRCGLNFNGAPGKDEFTDPAGNKREQFLTLHGRIANLPAHYVKARVNLQPPHQIEVIGQVDEASMFGPRLRLTSTLRTTPMSNRIQIHDVVTNIGGQPAELELLYHCNFGPPLLSETSRVLAPIQMLAPRDATAAEGLDQYSRFQPPTAGVKEQCYFMKLCTHMADDATLCVLRNGASDAACAIRYNQRQLPWFTLWKNPGAEADGYVIGLEPGTDLPNHRSFERARQRVITLAPGDYREVLLEIEAADTAEGVTRLAQEVERLQTQATLAIRRSAQSDLSPV